MTEKLLFDDEAFAMRKHQIEIQMGEYERAIQAAISWHQRWKAKQPQGFRAIRRSSGALQK